MDPNLAVKLGLAVLDGVLTLIASIRAQGGLTPEEILAHADAQDLQNTDAIKALLAL